MNKKEIASHRGYRQNKIHSNTLEAFKYAIDINSDMIELDVRESKDNVLIIFHDSKLYGKDIKKLNYDEIKSISNSRSFEIPTLKDTLQIVKDKIKLDIELKEDKDEDKVVEEVLKYLDVDSFFISSFNLISIMKIKKKYPYVKVGIIISKSKDLNENIINNENIDVFVLHYKIMKEVEKLKLIKDNGKKIYLWTVNNIKKIRDYLKNEYIDGIITDRPDKALKIRDGSE